MANLKTIVNNYNNNKAIKQQEVKSSYFIAVKFLSISGHHTAHEIAICSVRPFSKKSMRKEANKIVVALAQDGRFNEYHIDEIVEICYPDQTQDSCFETKTALSDSDTLSIKEVWNLMTGK